LKSKEQDSRLNDLCYQLAVANGDGQLQCISWPSPLITENSFHT